MSDRINVSIEGHVARVVLSRPGKYNALDQQAFDELVSAADLVAANSDIRVVLLSAEGDHFCAGADISFLQGTVSDPDEFRRRALHDVHPHTGNEFQKPALAWQALAVPVIAELQGITYGAGCQLALAADFRIASASLQMSLFEINWGLIPDMGVTATLPNLVCADVALEMVITGRIMDAADAQQAGLVTRVSDDIQTDAQALADAIAARSPDAVRAGKRLLRESAGLGRSAALQLEAQLQCTLVGSANQREAAAANMEKRVPEFR